MRINNTEFDLDRTFISVKSKLSRLDFYVVEISIPVHQIILLRIDILVVRVRRLAGGGIIDDLHSFNILEPIVLRIAIVGEHGDISGREIIEIFFDGALRLFLHFIEFLIALRAPGSSNQ